MIASDSVPALAGVLETALYVDNLARARDFYTRLFALAPMHEDPRLVALAIAPAQVLLLFLRGGSDATVTLPGGSIPPHDGGGRLHVAFAIAGDDLRRWEERLGELGVAVEARMAWPRGGHSLYFRDPDQHLLELATPGLWPNY